MRLLSIVLLIIPTPGPLTEEEIATPDDISCECITKSSFGEYGSYCYPWHLNNCNTTSVWEVGVNCCQSWCFVSSICDHKIQFGDEEDIYVTFSGCPDDRDLIEGCPYKGPALSPIVPRDPESCVCRDLNIGVNTTKYGENYGKWCSNWDEKSCRVWWDPPPPPEPLPWWDPPEQQDINPGSWCCQNWCYVEKECSGSLPSYLAEDLFYSYHTCTDDINRLHFCREPENGEFRPVKDKVKENTSIQIQLFFIYLFTL